MHVSLTLERLPHLHMSNPNSPEFYFSTNVIFLYLLSKFHMSLLEDVLDCDGFGLVGLAGCQYISRLFYILRCCFETAKLHVHIYLITYLKPFTFFPARVTMAQLVRQSSMNPRVGGPIPSHLPIPGQMSKCPWRRHWTPNLKCSCLPIRIGG